MRSVEIECQMLAVCGGQALTLTASGKTGVLRCKRLQGSKEALRIVPLLLKRKHVLQFIHRQFLAQQISLTLELCDRPVMNVGHRSKPGPVSKLLGLYPVEIRSFQLFTALLESALNA